MRSATSLAGDIRAALGGQPALKKTYEALRSMRWRLSDAWRSRAPRDPLDPWQRFPFIDTVRHADKLKSGGAYRPVTLQCETVNTCNNLCVICAYPQEQRKRTVMPMDVFEKVLRDYSEMGGGYLSLTPVTGDILLDRYLLQRLEMVKRYPRIRELGVTTNAVMLDRFTDPDVRSIVNAFDKLQISIYGLDEEEYVAMTKRRTYHRAIDAVRRILDVRTENVFLAFRLLKPYSQTDVEQWVEATFGRPVAINVMNGGYLNWSVLDTTQPLPFGATWRDHGTPAKSQCLLPLLAMTVCADGSVNFCGCVGNLEELVLGNIDQHTLVELYNTPRARALWNWQDCGVPASCARCTFHAPLETLRIKPSLIDDPFPWTGA